MYQSTWRLIILFDAGDRGIEQESRAFALSRSSKLYVAREQDLDILADAERVVLMEFQ
jgi:hypothetical protein